MPGTKKSIKVISFVDTACSVIFTGFSPWAAVSNTCRTTLMAMFAFGPLSGTALNVTLLSHCDNVHIGINHDPEAIHDTDALAICLERGIDEVLALGTPVAKAKAKVKAKAKKPMPRR